MNPRRDPPGDPPNDPTRDEDAETTRPTDSGDADIGQAFGRGEEWATELVRSRVRRIISFRGYGMQLEDRRDVEQEVMIQLWQTAQRPGTELGDRFWGLVEVVTVRRCIDWLRGRRTQLELSPALVDGDDPLGRVLARERVTLASSALLELPDPCRELIRLHAVVGKSYRELSLMLGKSEGALRVQMHRCIRTASEILGRLGGGPEAAPNGPGGDG